MKYTISAYVDDMIVETILNDPKLYKKAEGGYLSGATDLITNYIQNHTKKDGVLKSIVNLLLPGAIGLLLGGWVGIFASVALKVFNVDFYGILGKIKNKLLSIFTGKDKKISEPEVDSLVTSTVEENSPTLTDEQMEASVAMLSKSSNIQYARMIKLAMIDYKYSKTAGIGSSLLSMFSSAKSKNTNVIITIIKFILKAALVAAGLMVGKDAVLALSGKPSGFTHKMKDGEPVMPTFKTTQTKFKVKSSYHDVQESDWSLDVTNNTDSISNLIVKFANEVYEDLADKESIIKNTIWFKKVVEEISWYNHSTPDAKLIFMPRIFTSKKQIVDYFIDEVAKAT